MVEKKDKVQKGNLIDLGKRGKYHLRNKVNNLTGKEWVKFTKSWDISDVEDKESFFIINPKRRNEEVILHPAKYPEELVKKLIEFFTKEGEVVFDPFLGTGSTLVAAKESKRKGIGIELMEKYAKISMERIKESLNKDHFVITGNSKDFLLLKDNNGKSVNEILKEMGNSQVDLVVTSPPYWDMLKKSRGNIISSHKKHINSGRDEHYGDSEGDFGNIEDYEEYMNNLIETFHNCYDILKQKGYLVIVIQNIRTPNGEMKPLAWDLGMRLSKKYVLKQEKLWLQNNKRLNCWGYPSTYVSNVHHHYCLVFQKC